MNRWYIRSDDEFLQGLIERELERSGGRPRRVGTWAAYTAIALWLAWVASYIRNL